ncbi:cilia- and flagella-associated protein 69-like isoform X3 [Ptiloglossa arizonensis]|uniref:cilia- and flagella-associated protein 69-like isoform X3 n=1 Tax=Ptiloglossa arizonensis TaxID=3350558 RepID=UPI003F9F887F
MNRDVQSESKDRLFHKLDIDDVWKEFNCPIYINRKCPETDKLPKELFDFGKQFQVDVNYTLQKLDELISDPVTCNSVPRICRLLYEYLCTTEGTGYVSFDVLTNHFYSEKVKDLPSVMKILAFLAKNVTSIKEYELHLDQMLELCNLLPLLEKSSESLITLDIMEQYFTLLGHLLAILPTDKQALKIYEALRSLLLRTNSTNAATVKLEYRHRAMEKSRLPIILTNLLENSLPDTYPTILELIFLLSSVSYTCSHRMLEAGVLDIILVRFDLPYATQLRCTRPPDSLLDRGEYTEQTTILIMNTLWSLIKSVLSPKNEPVHLKKTLKSVHCAVWGLCYTFEKQIYYSQYQSNSIKIRNEIAVIILALLVTFPSWNYVSSGIADNVVKFLVAVESGTVRVFSEIVKFGRTNDDLFFQKVLLLTVTQLAKIDACIFLMVKRKVMKTILQLVNPSIEEDSTVTWSASQFWNLWTYAINALAVLAPKMSKEFVRYDGTIRLLMLLEWSLSTNFDTEIIMNCTKTICSIILNELINRILNCEKITTKKQRILTVVLISLERLLRKQKFYQEMYGEQSIIFIMELLFQCLYQKDQENQIDQRLLLAIGSYIWECIVRCPMNLEKFIKYGAVYIILDVIQIVPYPSRCLFLSVLTDMCDNFFCGPYLCTWRGINKKTGLMALLATIWREEEIRIKVKRYPNDKEFPQMGNQQWLETYGTKLCGDISPSILDMIGSVRSKIYSIRKLIKRDSERYEIAKEHYKILYIDLPKEDRITISHIDLYFKLKLGQVWVEISRYFDQVGVIPLGMDGQAIFLMTQQYYSFVEMIKERQEKIIKSLKRKEEIQEKDEYAKIRDSKLASALDAFDELDYIYRTTNRAYMIKRKNEQIQQINSALNFPSDSSDAHCHRTFVDKTMVTTIYDQHLTIISSLAMDSNLGQTKVLPISPYRSDTFDDIHSSEISSSPLLNNNLFEIKEFHKKT